MAEIENKQNEIDKFLKMIDKWSGIKKTIAGIAVSIICCIVALIPTIISMCDNNKLAQEIKKNSIRNKYKYA